MSNPTKAQARARLLAIDTDEVLETLATLRRDLADERATTARLQGRVAELQVEVQRLRADALAELPKARRASRAAQ